ncbi:protein of unknown function [[Clostridium] ultunense Esp]|uniref:Uncharacterized protein n=1 Tax=[Clostridium] ultunense Esp TaxID=1288971 RepID=A0A1M4PLK0_9FIRM|nr:protein of unknown function [[Clostridium] ultunense Esp]
MTIGTAGTVLSVPKIIYQKKMGQENCPQCPKKEGRFLRLDDKIFEDVIWSIICPKKRREVLGWMQNI